MLTEKHLGAFLNGKASVFAHRTFAAFFVKALLLSGRIPDAGCVGEDKRGILNPL